MSVIGYPACPLVIYYHTNGVGEGSKVPVGTLVLTPRPESDVSNPGPDPLDQTFT